MMTLNASKADVFALGVTLFVILFGRPPFIRAEMGDNFYRLIARQDPSFWKANISTRALYEQNLIP